MYTDIVSAEHGEKYHEEREDTKALVFLVGCGETKIEACSRCTVATREGIACCVANDFWKWMHFATANPWAVDTEGGFQQGVGAKGGTPKS